MANAEGGPPPGWYADPAGEHRFRWWDGVQWTEHVNDGDDPGAEELTARAEEPQPAPAPSEPVVASSDEPAAVVYTPGPDIGGPAEAGYDPDPVVPDPGPPPGSAGADGATALGPPPGARAEDHRSRSLTPVLAGVGALVIVGLLAYLFVFRDGGSDRDREADQARAEGAVLVLADLPAGWEAGPADPDSATTEFTAEGCDHLTDVTARADDEPNADSPSFEETAGVSAIENSIAVFGGNGDANSFLDRLAQPETGPCLENLIRDAFEESAEESPVINSDSITRVEATPLAPVFGDRAVGWRVAIDVELGGDTATFFSDLLMVRVDRAVSAFQFQNAFTPFDAGVQTTAITAVVERLRSE
ncbi:MAG: DUF2510 domain-containing protein [Acidimicrobiales bacterium]|nr:DUF2510 domain-containing protein [Acidimicrobiales bacterium]